MLALFGPSSKRGGGENTTGLNPFALSNCMVKFLVTGTLVREADSAEVLDLC